MELYTGELLFGTHENLEHLALMDGLFCFPQCEKFVLLKLLQHQNQLHGPLRAPALWCRKSKKTDTSCNIWGRFPFWRASTTKQKTLWSTAGGKFGRLPFQDAVSSDRPTQGQVPGLKDLKILKGKNWPQVKKKCEAYEIPVFWSLRLLWLLQKNLQSWVRYLARDRHGGWKLNWL